MQRIQLPGINTLVYITLLWYICHFVTQNARNTSMFLSGLGIHSFQKNVPFFAFFSILLKRTEHSLRSFPIFLKEGNDLCVTYRMEKNGVPNPGSYSLPLPQIVKFIFLFFLGKIMMQCKFSFSLLKKQFFWHVFFFFS